MIPGSHSNAGRWRSGMARDATVLTHDVADVFDDGEDIGHESEMGQNGAIW